MKRIASFALLAVTLVIGVFLLPHASAQTKVACIGDSITYGSWLTNREVECYPVVLQRLLGPAFVVTNCGVSGATMLKRGNKPYWKQAAFTNSTDWNPDVVIIMLGSNDSKPTNWAHKADFVSDYNAMIAHYASVASKPKIYICTPCPAYSETRFTISSNVVHTEIVPAVRNIGRSNSVEVIDVHVGMSGHPEWFCDEVHPNAIGASNMASVIYTSISPKK